jgi:hypothetical protein
MLARIQTIYLILAALLAFGSMALPFWSFSAGQLFLITDFSSFREAGILYSAGSIASGICSPLTGIVSLAAMITYRNRKLQKNLILLGIVLFAGDMLSGLTTAHFMNQYFQSTGMAVTHKPEAGLFMLLPEPVLFWLSLKGVRKDEKIATAYKRL